MTVWLAACGTKTENLIATSTGSSIAGDYPKSYTFDNWLHAHPGGIPDPAIVLSFSGGFLHAAGLANGLLQALAEYTICKNPAAPETKSTLSASGTSSKDCSPLIDHVILISSTSGGGFANVNYLVNGRAGLGVFEAQFLRKDLAGTLLKNVAVRPWTWLSVVGPASDRAKYMMHTLNEGLLDPKTHPHHYGDVMTFGDLDPRAPFAIFGSTDYTAERHFTFTQESFDDLCSDLSKYPIANAVTASGAFPFLLTDVELKNYWPDGHCPLTPAPATARPDASQNFDTRYTDKQKYFDLRYADSLRRAGDTTDPPFHPEAVVHLFDGGIADNLAIRPIIKLLDRERLASDEFKDKTILFIEVSARTDPSTSAQTETGSPWLWKLVTGVPYASIDNDTQLSSYAAFAYWNSLFYCSQPGLLSPCPAGSASSQFARQLYFTEIDYDQDADYDPVLKVAGQYRLKEMGGTSLSADDVNLLKRAATNLLAAHPCFINFLGDPAFSVSHGSDTLTIRADPRCIVLRRGNFGPTSSFPAIEYIPKGKPIILLPHFGIN